MTEAPTVRLRPEAAFHAAESLDADQVGRWREFSAGLPQAHYYQDPAWAEIERARARPGVRRPVFFWAESGGELCLTALGVVRRLPVPGRVFLEFNRGPNVADRAVLHDWLLWLSAACGHRVVRMRVQPPLPLAAGGDDVETLLELHGFRRRRALGMWATLKIDIGREEADILASFRQATRYSIRKSIREGVVVSAQDTPGGWRTLVELQTEMTTRAEVSVVGVDELAAVSRHWLRGGEGGTVLVAHLHGEPLAAALVVTHAQTAYAPLVPSSRRHGKQSASHLLVWEAMRWARGRGCTVYDPVGYSMAALPGDPLWGINQFKRGFGSLDDLAKSAALHEKACSPVLAAAASTIRRRERRATAVRAGDAGALVERLGLRRWRDDVRSGSREAGTDRGE